MSKVTGAGSGIGREICVSLARREKNLTLICWDIDKIGNEKTVTELKELGVKNVHGYQVDVADRAQVETTAFKVNN